jgi:hypothetical protein
MTLENRWSEPAISDVEWRAESAPAYVDLDMVQKALALPEDANGRPGVALLCCDPEAREDLHPGPPYRYWVTRVIALDIDKSKSRNNIFCTVLTSHGVRRDDDTADLVRLEYLAVVGRFLSRVLKEGDHADTAH